MDQPQRTLRTAHALIMVVASFVATLVIGLVYTEHRLNDLEHKFCGVIELSDEAAKARAERPTATDIEREGARRVHQLRRDLGC